METLEILKQCTVDGKIVRLPEIQLDRKQYLDVKNKLELIGGKWKGGKTNGFVFEEDATELLEAVANGDNRNLKKEYQFFSTPWKMRRKAIDLLPAVAKDMKILEPEAGDGAFVQALVHEFKLDRVDCFELMELNRIKLSKVAGANIIGEDFLQCDLKDTYDIIVANPPFTKNHDIDHIRKMFEVCKPGGTIVTFASTSWVRGEQKKQVEFRQWLDELGAYTEEIPEGEFKESGTSVATMLIKIEKPAVEKKKVPDHYHFLREYRNDAIYESPIDDKNTKVIVLDKDLKERHSFEFEKKNSNWVNKAIEKAKEWIDLQRSPNEILEEIKALNEESSQTLNDLEAMLNDTPEVAPDEEKEYRRPERTCRECGCTEYNCRQCIVKTGKACHWVEEDLCSACVPVVESKEQEVPQIKVTDTRAVTMQQNQSPSNENEMNFFSQLSAIGEVDLSMRIMKVNDKLTMEITPGNKSKNIKPWVITASPEELDENFFKTISPDIKEIAGLVSNAADVKEELKQKAEKKKEATAAPKNSDKKKSDRKQANKSKAKKTAPVKEVKKEEPSLFDAAPEKEEEEESVEA